MWARRRLASSFGLLAFAFCLVSAGCRSNCDLVEAELRTKELQLANLREERDHLIAQNEALHHQLGLINGPAPYKVSADGTRGSPVRALALGRQTGGVDDDGQPGDEALQVLVEPRDAAGRSVKVPGTLTVQAIEITPEGLKKPLCSWDVPADVLARSWKDGLLTTGYSLVLPWKVWPSSEKLRVVAQFAPAGGRTFEAEKDVTVRLVPVANRKALPEPADGGDGPPLPPPRPLEGADGLGWRATPAQGGEAQPAALWQPARKPSVADVVRMRAPVPMPARAPQ
jgi:hypothetical protein